MKIKIEFKQEIKEIAKEIKFAGGQMFVVGGAVRDAVMGIKAVDQDFMIQGISEDKAKEIVSVFSSKVKDVISNAPVFMARIGDEDFEFAMARIEVDVAPGKSGFEFISHPGVSVRDDMVRRDVRIGAIAVDVISGEVFDPFDGVQDIQNRVIRHVSSDFAQSPERVFRVASQAARFDFDVADETIAVMASMKDSFSSIPREQIWRHFEKAGEKAIAPERFIDVMVDCGWIEFFPEIHVDEAREAVKGSKFDVCAFFAGIMAGMSFEEEIAFSERICAPKHVFKRAVEIKEFGPEGKPKAWVQGRDIIHMVSPGPEMGHWCSWAFIGQINGIFKSKEEAVAWIEEAIS